MMCEFCHGGEATDAWRGKDGRVFYGQDSGCSCPSPFEDWNFGSYEDFAKEAERVGSYDQVQRILKETDWVPASEYGDVPKSWFNWLLRAGELADTPVS